MVNEEKPLLCDTEKTTCRAGTGILKGQEWKVFEYGLIFWMRKCKASDQARGETFRSVPFTPFLSLLLYLSEWGEIYLSIIFWCLFSHLSLVSSTLGLLLFSRPSLSLVSLALLSRLSRPFSLALSLSPLLLLWFLGSILSCHPLWFLADGCSECLPERKLLSGAPAKAAALHLQPTTARCNQCF